MKKFNNKIIKKIINCVAVVSFLSLIGITIAFVGCEDVGYGFECETYIFPIIAISLASTIAWIAIDN